jgi:hypothetical protein
MIMSGLQLEKNILPENDNIIFAEVDRATGLVANNKCLDRVSVAFIDGTQPQSFAPCSGLAAQLKNWFSIEKGNLQGARIPVQQKNK